MPKVLENIITGAVADPKTHTVTLTWANGATTVNRFDRLVGKGVFAAFVDPAFFARVSVGERGRSLEWPGELDFCADALWFEATRRMRRSSKASPIGWNVIPPLEISLRRRPLMDWGLPEDYPAECLSRKCRWHGCVHRYGGAEGGAPGRCRS